MSSRTELNRMLRKYCDNVYFQPPENLKLKYPCIVYAPNDVFTVFAGNHPYKTLDKYNLTLISETATYTTPWDIIENEPYVSYTNAFNADGLYHTVLTLETQHNN